MSQGGVVWMVAHLSRVIHLQSPRNRPVRRTCGRLQQSHSRFKIPDVKLDSQLTGESQSLFCDKSF